MADTTPKVWFITGKAPISSWLARTDDLFDHRQGTSSGFGLHLVKVVLSRGDYVVATARSLHAIQHLETTNCKILELDVTSNSDVLMRKAEEAIGFWGRVDVVVNNAGFAGLGIAEEAGCVPLITSAAKRRTDIPVGV